MLISLLTGLTAATLALANPVAHYPRNDVKSSVGGGDDTKDMQGHEGTGSAGDWLQVTSVEYSGNGCPEGSLTGEFCPETTSFNVSIADLKAQLEDHQPDDVSYCYIKVGLRTKASKQVNALAGNFIGHVNLESEGMSAYIKNTYSYEGNEGSYPMRWDFKDKVNLDTVFTNELKTTFLSPCGGDFTLIIDSFLSLTRGDKAGQTDDGFIEVSRLTGSLGHALVLEQKDCEQSDNKDDKSKGDDSDKGGEKSATGY
ncbi:hypothetical protein MPH_10259 [Macrophomina phaseolina MS6]|uniref:Secreted protein n=1 Tax=Macrophomina phaseolina (strain MS6) TaxID=1126212 RepID=K2RDG4_MACPH|nr:hypothetical protein MPH_10259 [Macrophomina phaseolina MS6]